MITAANITNIAITGFTLDTLEQLVGAKKTDTGLDVIRDYKAFTCPQPFPTPIFPPSIDEILHSLLIIFGNALLVGDIDDAQVFFLLQRLEISPDCLVQIATPLLGQLDFQRHVLSRRSIKFDQRVGALAIEGIQFTR